jgi:hypothetical protein
LKKRKPAQTPAPFMNKTLRKEIYKKRMLIWLLLLLPFFDKNGFIVGQKSDDFGPPTHLSKK